MANILVIGDIHQKVGRLNELLDQYESAADYTVFTGDYFDDFNDSCMEVEAMASWLRDNLFKPDRVFLMGNHDFQYMLPAGVVYCSGYAAWKREVIDSILDSTHWDQIGYFHAHESLVDDAQVNYWFSHAGITRHWFEHPVYGTTTSTIKRKLATTQLAVKGLTRDWGCIYAADKYRGGPYQHGGLLWSDWRGIELHDNTTQIVGHSPHYHVVTKLDKESNSMCINNDTGLRQAIMLNTDTNTFDVLS